MFLEIKNSMSRNNFKKILFLIYSVLIVIVPLRVFATSGACSYHGGVDCSAGPLVGGGVICNDGWSDSSVNYYDTYICGGTDPRMQTLSKACSGLNPNDYPDYSKLQIQLQTDCMENMCPTTPCANSVEFINGLNNCIGTSKDEAYVQVLNKCTELKLNQICPENSTYQSTDNLCHCNEGFFINDNKCVKNTCPDNSFLWENVVNLKEDKDSFLLTNNDKCVCVSGYVNYKHQCIKESEVPKPAYTPPPAPAPTKIIAPVANTDTIHTEDTNQPIQDIQNQTFVEDPIVKKLPWWQRLWEWFKSLFR
ncbi:hypothetical protein HZB93_00765 [Candidatus Falkowbacteria bacterium]|nr:hypothetical protein [Candidatus Falkowbacteria bacterium]